MKAQEAVAALDDIIDELSYKYDVLVEEMMECQDNGDSGDDYRWAVTDLEEKIAKINEARDLIEVI